MEKNKTTRKVKLALLPRNCEGGAIGCLVKNKNVMTGKQYWEWFAGRGGLCTNLGDPDHKYTSGWLGTTDDWAVFAQGLWQIVDIKHNRPTRTYTDGSVTLSMQSAQEEAA
jgi:hypothetical protein